MDTIKKYWWLILVLPVVGYFVWEYIKSKNDIGSKMEKVREAKAIKAIIKTEPEPETVGTDDRTN
jgi:hypothetical protein